MVSDWKKLTFFLFRVMLSSDRSKFQERPESDNMMRELLLRFLQDRSGRHFSAQSDLEWEERRLDEIYRSPDAKLEKAGIIPPILLALIIAVLCVIARA